jgi:hypothetical protein
VLSSASEKAGKKKHSQLGLLDLCAAACRADTGDPYERGQKIIMNPLCFFSLSQAS